MWVTFLRHIHIPIQLLQQIHFVDQVLRFTERSLNAGAIKNVLCVFRSSNYIDK